MGQNRGLPPMAIKYCGKCCRVLGYGLKRKYRCSIREMGFKVQLDCFLFKNLYGKMIPKLAHLLTC